MKAFLTIVFFLSVSLSLSAQWSDNFSDGEFVSDPVWMGNAPEFIVEREILRLNAPALSGQSNLSTLSDIGLEAEWKFWTKLEFDPSSSNFIKVYLMANNADLTNVQNGYFVKIGGTPDEISLYKVFEGNETLLIDGLDGRVKLTNVEANIKVTRSSVGTWELKSKLLGESSFSTEGSILDLEIKQSSYFGIVCQYTSTRSTKMYLDDVAVSGRSFVDSDPPYLLSVTTPSTNQIQLVFNEALNELAATNTANYVLNNIENPISATVISVNTILIEFSNALELTNTLAVSGILDVIGNQLDALINVLFVDPSSHNYGEVVFNELLPDPSPQEDLPAFEFVELLNNSSKIINLNGWQFTDGSTIATLPYQLLYPDSLLILCPMEANSVYQQFGTTVGLSKWPTLNNSGDAIKLLDDQGNIIDSINYTTKWYHDTSKDNGGFSLELINPNAKCTGIYNWVFSNDTKGGTPGKPNSVLNEMQDLDAPFIAQALVQDGLVQLWFSELVFPNLYEAFILPDNISVSMEIGAPTLFATAILSQKLNEATIYSIEMLLEDCSGNIGLAESNLIPIAFAQKGEVVINELLFDPFAGGEDFIELFNNTSLCFNLQGFIVGNETTSKTISDTTLLLMPHHYLALSKNIAFLKNQYLAPDSSLFETNLPTMPNEEGIIVLKSISGNTLDSVFYSEDYHFSLISDTEGISIERISLEGDSSNPDNWKSAAQTVGFATPGFKNSHATTLVSRDEITITPQIITPNNDGQTDFCQIVFAFESSSQTITINVYDLNGRLVNKLANNVLIPPQGFFTWDGTNQQGVVLPTAHYIIVSEVIGSKGRTQTYRKKVVVANGF